MRVESNSPGIGVVGLLGVLFVGLKLGGIINWSWWLVTLPFWGVLVLVVAVIAFAAVTLGCIALIRFLAKAFTK